MLTLTLIVSLVLQDPDSARIRAEQRARRIAENAARQAAVRDSIESGRQARAASAILDAYADSNTMQLVARARAARLRNERLVTYYQALVRQRIGVGLRALRRDRMLFGQELAARVEWNRDGASRIEVLGARQRVPIALRGDQVPEDLGDNVEWMVFDPAADYLRFVGDDDEGFQYPLRAAAEIDYTYSLGDTTTIRLPGGRVVSLVELNVRPRRADFRLMNGSLWFDADSYALVRAVFAPARPFDLELDGDSGDADDVPGILKPIRGEVRYVTLEYGLYEQRWWMPRYLAIDMEAQASAIRVPVRFERTYEGYQVRGGAEPVAGARRPAGSVRPRELTRDSAETAIHADSVGRAIAACVQRTAQEERRADSVEGRRRVTVGTGPDRRFERRCWREMQQDDRWPIDVVVPDDTASLLASTELGAPILDMGDVISEDELRQLGREIGAIPQAPWQYRPTLPNGLWSVLRNARFNRVEGLSLGLDGTLDWGRLRLDAVARIGYADLEPRGELGLTRPTANGVIRLGGYRRLAVANPETRALGVGNSLSAFFLQRDDGEYFQTLGAEITARNTTSGWWQARFYAEQQRASAAETNVSIPRLFSSTNFFRPNITARRAGQFGAAVSVNGTRVLSRSLLAGATLAVDGTTGTETYARSALTLSATITPAGPIAVALEGAAGMTVGDTVSPQGRFYLGGPATIRGFPGGTAAGERFWRGRVEVANSFPAFRIVGFFDAGGAGTAGLGWTRMYAAGAGISVLDGLIRLDLARGIKPYGNWRFDAYLDGLF